MRGLFRFGLFVFLLGLQSCTNETEFENNVLAPLSLASIGKDFPLSENEALRCLHSRSASCATFQSAYQAKKALVSMEKSEAFKLSLGAFRRLCPEALESGRAETNYWICVGSLEAFYFLTGESEDREIIKAFSEHPGLVKKALRTGNFQFFRNRTAKEEWNAFIESNFGADIEKGYRNPLDTTRGKQFDHVHLLELRDR